MKVISFCIYGSAEKYCRGLLENLEIIQQDLPDYNVFIYVGNDVANWWLDKYIQYPFVRLFYTHRLGHDNMINRFFAIDEPDVEIAFSRDADSRIHKRDLWCIRDFEKSSYTFSTIRDHSYHKALIMGGLWGIKKSSLCITDLYKQYNYDNITIDKIQHDQLFLSQCVYPFVFKNLVVYTFNENMRMGERENMKFIEEPIENENFCGQVVLYDANGNSYTDCQWF